MKSKPYEYAQNLHYTKGLTTTGLKLRGVRPISYKPNKSRPFEFIKTSEITSDRNSELFDRITLSPLQDHLIEALHIIDPRIKNINFISDGFANPNKRSPYVVYEGSNMRYKLSSMGDGINRILTIILALLNCENGTLLIDEYENGLH